MSASRTPPVDDSSSVAPYSRSAGLGDRAAERLGHRLEAVADAEDRDAGVEQRRVELRGAVGVDAATGRRRG